MFANRYKSPTAFPICVQVPGVSSGTRWWCWKASEKRAKAFNRRSKGGAAEFQPVSVNEQVMEKDGQGARVPGREAQCRADPS